MFKSYYIQCNRIYYLIMFLIVFITHNEGQGQILKPESWMSEVAKSEIKNDSIWTLRFKVELEDGWYIYASDIESDLGPTPATVEFEPKSSYKLVGDLVTIDAKEKFDMIWMGMVRYIKKEGVFQQKVKLLLGNPVINATISYQTCSDLDGKCILGEESFEFKINTTN